MYSFKDYVSNGMVYVGNMFRLQHKMLSQLMIYATTCCQSRCKHCHIWKKEMEMLSLEDIMKIMMSKCVTKNTTVGLEGGEFVLHPQADEIMGWFAANHRNYTLLSNCLAYNKVIGLTKRYKPSHLYVSLDGNKETYKQMRGIDGYDSVIKVVEAVKGTVPVSLMFCLSPWNSFADMEYVVNMAKHFGVDVRIGIYGSMSFFDTNVDMIDAGAGDWHGNIPESVKATDENYDFIALYGEWIHRRLKLPCQSILSELVVHSNGNVPLCQNLDVILGNIHEQSLDEIFNSVDACKVQQRYSRNCNGCWINFHRKYDIVLFRNLERILSKKIVEFFYGKYQWSGMHDETYKHYFSRIKKL